MHARSTTIRGKPEAIDAGIAFIRDEVMPAITALEGCVGMSLVVERETGRGIATSSWLDAAAMHASDEAMMPLRVRGGEVLGGAPEVEEWEVAHMHRDHATHDGSCCRITWSRIQDVDAAVEPLGEHAAPADRAARRLLQRQPARRPGRWSRLQHGDLRLARGAGGQPAAGHRDPRDGHGHGHRDRRGRRARPGDRSPAAARAGLSTGRARTGERGAALTPARRRPASPPAPAGRAR